MWETIKGEWQAKLLILMFIVLSVWWLFIQFPPGNKSPLFEFYGVVYGVLALLGGIWGIQIAMKWGGLKSALGKSLFMFALGLFAQEFGQITYFIYVFFLHIEVPYPSIGDIGYFGSIPFYILGTIYLARVAGVKISLKSYLSKAQALIIPAVILGAAYFFFLQDYAFDTSKPLTVFLDFAYPLGQAIYISIALLTYTLTRNMLGGIMKSKILFILFALLVQFLSDYTFLFQSSRGIWTPHGINDFMYQVAYFVMVLGLLQLGAVLKKLKT